MQAILVARFQIPQIDDNIQSFLKSLTDHYDDLIIILGQSPLPSSKNNPFRFESRKQMLLKEYPSTRILALKDHPNDKIWSENLDKLIDKNTSGKEVLVLGSKDHFIPYYSGKYKSKETGNHYDIKSPEIKEEFKNLEYSSADFRAGMTYAYHKVYDTVNPTVDVAVFRNDKKEILLGKKPINNKWRFIGGFVDPTDESYEEAALRELKEESGKIEVSNMKYVCSQKVNDWRYRFEKDKIITTLFQCEFVSGNLSASDDISDLRWFSVNDLPGMIAKDEITPEHERLFRKLLKVIEQQN